MYIGYIKKDLKNHRIAIETNVIDKEGYFMVWFCKQHDLYYELQLIADYVHQVYHDEIKFKI